VNLKTLSYAALCILWAGVGIGSAGQMMIAFPIKFFVTAFAFFLVGMFFTLGFRASRQAKDAKTEPKS
jgi:hypothetical protein